MYPGFTPQKRVEAGMSENPRDQGQVNDTEGISLGEAIIGARRMKEGGGEN